MTHTGISHKAGSRYSGILRLLVACWVMVITAATQAYAQQAPPAGTSIDNTARAVQYLQQRQDSLVTLSNTVRAVVSAAPRIGLEPEYSVQRRRGQRSTFRHTITNNGNAAGTYTVTLEDIAGDDFNFDLVELLPDTAAGNSQIAANSARSAQGLGQKIEQPHAEPVPGGGTLRHAIVLAEAQPLQVELQPGESVRFRVRLRVPNSARPGQQGAARLTARLNGTDVTAVRIDRIRVLEGPTIRLQKRQQQGVPAAGGSWQYTLSGANTGDQTARATNIVVDGVSRQQVLITDDIPANTTFERFENAAAIEPLYHITGTPAFNYVSTVPANRSQVDQIAVTTDSLNPGEQLSFSFNVRINANAGGAITNEGNLWYIDPFNQDEIIREDSESNEVVAELPAENRAINYYSADSYTTVSRVTNIGRPLRVQANATACNVQFGTADSVQITLQSQQTDDREVFGAVETGTNTGVFRITPNVATRSAEANEVVPGNQIMETRANDVITATIPSCGDAELNLQTQINVSPQAVVFDSQTGQPVAAAQVTLINTETGEAAAVQDDAESGAVDNPQTTGSDGVFRFPYVAAGTYRLAVETPAGYSFASVVAPENIPENRTVDAQASYGESFTTEQPGPATFDIPLDPDTQGALFTEKTSSATGASIGDFISYEITVTNNRAAAVPNVRVDDTLPFGFRYEEGTTTINGEEAADPAGGKGPELQFNVGAIEGGISVTIRYRVLIGAGAREGEATNTATATSEGTLTQTSNRAQHTVDVRTGVFTDKGYIIGKVFTDYNKNGVQDKGEVGVPGVQLYLENGNFVVTDSEGMYTFYGINPNKHILKLDNYSLPQGAKLEALDNRFAGDAGSRFVDLKNGQMHRADFALCDITPAVQQAIDQRRKEYAKRANSEIGASVDRDLQTTERTGNRSVKRADASGIVGGNQQYDQQADTTATPRPARAMATPDSLAYDSAGTPAAGPARPSGQPAATDSTARSPSQGASAKVDMVFKRRGPTLEQAMETTPVELGFINLSAGDTLGANQTRVWLKSPLGATLNFKVNGQAVSNDKLGKTAMLKSRTLQAYDFIGVEMQPGPNTLTLLAKDNFGNVRDSTTIQVYAPGKIDAVQLQVLNDEVSADGKSTAKVRVRVTDKDGILIKAPLLLTLDTSVGKWLADDLNPSEPGLQFRLEGGQRMVELQAPLQPADATVRASLGVVDDERQISFLPDLRPLIAAGIIEGTIRLNDGASMVPARSADGFERELKSLAYDFNNYTADARAAFFLKGKIKGNMLLTAGFDSEKDDDQLFRDIQPDEFYPVYGESSVKGYDAQSTSRLYVRVDRKKTYALYGDFQTQERYAAKSLGEYNRTQTGLQLHYENERASVTAFGAQASSMQRIEEFRGQGISGPYQLDSDDILVNSEQVELITRDRNQPSIILEREKLTRFRDYSIEPFTGNLVFSSAVRSADQQLNPVFIRVTYEVRETGEQYWMGGADGQFAVTNFMQVGGSFVEDRNPEDKYRLKSVNTTFALGENTVLMAEGAESTTDLQGTGRGGRVELQHRGDVIDGRIYAGQTERNFVNQSSQLGQGRTEAGARGSINVAQGTNVEGEFLYTSNDTLNKNTTGGLINLQQQISGLLSAEVGFRYVRQDQSPLGAINDSSAASNATNKNLRGQLTMQVPTVEGASVFGEYEQDISDSGRRLIAAGGEYTLANRGKFYARHEFISSALGAYQLNSAKRRQNTVAGFETNYMQNGEVYSEYRVENAFDGRSAQAAIGLRNRFEVYEGFGINARFERIFSLEGDPRNEGTAIATALDYTANPLWKGTARLEGRFSGNGNTYLNTLGYGRKLNQNWTFLGKNIFSLRTSGGNRADEIQQRMRLGFAYREVAQNRFDALGRYELKYEENGQFGGNYDRLVHIFSTNVNYHPANRWTHSGRLAAKKVGESSAEFDSESLTMLLSARSIYDITRKLDGGLNASIMSDAGFGSKDYGLGGELGYIVQRNLRLAVGYNLTGFDDPDLAASNYTQHGIYVGFSYKFDERLFRGLMPDDDRNDRRYKQCNTDCQTAMTELAYPVAAAPRRTLPAPAFNWAGLQPGDIEAQPLRPRGMPGTFARPQGPQNVHFATNTAALSPETKKQLNRLSQLLRRSTLYTLALNGYTDRHATPLSNRQLSQRRAAAVKTYLENRGVDAAKIIIISHGEGGPNRAPAGSIISEAQNRKVSFDVSLDGIKAFLVPQIDDLQVDASIGSEQIKWDYIFNPKIAAVPDRLHIQGNTMGLSTQYLLDRLQLALAKFTDERLTVYLNGPQAGAQRMLLRNYLSSTDADLSRISFVLDEAREPGPDGMVQLQYGPATKLTPVAQRDDVRFASGKYLADLLREMHKLMQDIYFSNIDE